jgi:hypothetical protein
MENLNLKISEELEADYCFLIRCKIEAIFRTSLVNDQVLFTTQDENL